MTSLLYIQVLGVILETPPQVNIKLDLLCECEAPTQTHKAHHQASKPPTQNTRGFSPNERANLVPTTIPTCLAPRPLVGMPPMLQKHQHSLLLREAFHLPSLGSCLPHLDPLAQLFSNRLIDCSPCHGPFAYTHCPL
jgi:hypothetical protein